MTNKQQFSGVWTALVTPFNEDLSIDYDALAGFIDMQIEGGITGVLFMGTTGENPTIGKDEGIELVTRGVEMIDGRCQVMVGVGTYSTQGSVNNAKIFGTMSGIDILMAVNPYYNKPTQEGLYRHFTAIAQSTKLPMIVYNIKGRTAVNVETETLVRIREDNRNIVGVKEASGNIEQMKDVIAQTDDDFVVLSGDDGITFDLISAGGNGIISVAANVIPGAMVEMVNLALNGNLLEAGKLNDHLNDFFNGEFIQTNPLPIKTALAYMGKCKEIFRLPMCPMDSGPKDEWLKILGKYI